MRPVVLSKLLLAEEERLGLVPDWFGSSVVEIEQVGLLAVSRAILPAEVVRLIGATEQALV